MSMVIAGVAIGGLSAIGLGVSGYLQSEGAKEAARLSAEGATTAAETAGAATTAAAGIVSQAQADAIAAQQQAQDDALALQQQQFDKINAIFQPYVQAGNTAFDQQQALAGLGGADAQRAAINALSQGSEFQALMAQGEDALLQDSAATGGVRGGNTAGMLAQYRPAMLTNLIEQQYSRLGGIAGAGYNAKANIAQAAGNVGNMGTQTYLQTGSGIADAFNSGGQAQAGITMQGGQTQAQYAQAIADANAQRALATGNQLGQVFVNPLLQGLGYGTGFFNAFSPPGAGGGGLGGGGSAAKVRTT